MRPGGPIPEQHMSGEEATVCDIRTPQVSENHFRENSLQNIQNKSVTLWQKIIKTTISLPTPHLRLYDEQGLFIGIRDYQNKVTEEMETEMETELEENEDMDTTLDQEGENAQETVTVLVTSGRIKARGECTA